MTGREHNQGATMSVLPLTLERTLDLIQSSARATAIAQRIATSGQPLVGVDWGERVMRRFDLAHAPGVWASQLAQSFVPRMQNPLPAGLILARSALRGRAPAPMQADVWRASDVPPYVTPFEPP